MSTAERDTRRPGRDNGPGGEKGQESREINGEEEPSSAQRNRDGHKRLGTDTGMCFTEIFSVDKKLCDVAILKKLRRRTLTRGEEKTP